MQKSGFKYNNLDANKKIWVQMEQFDRKYLRRVFISRRMFSAPANIDPIPRIWAQINDLSLNIGYFLLSGECILGQRICNQLQNMSVYGSDAFSAMHTVESTGIYS